jgi:hypothetical protein
VIAPEFKGEQYPIEGIDIKRIITYDFQVGDFTPLKFKIKDIRDEISKGDVIFSNTLGPIGAMSIIQGRKLGKKIISYVHSLEWELFAKSVTTNKNIEKYCMDFSMKPSLLCNEIFDEGISGFGFEPRNIKSLVEALEKFIELPYENKKNMGIAGRKKVETEFNREIVLNQYIREIENAI